MHESESGGQVHQSVKEGGQRRQDGGIEAAEGVCVCGGGVVGVKLMASWQQR